MQIEYNQAKRDKTLVKRGLDFARAGEVFAGPTLDLPDDRYDYGEQRVISFGVLDDRMVVLVWTERKSARRIISMRKANEREIQSFSKALG